MSKKILIERKTKKIWLINESILESESFMLNKSMIN